MGQGQTKQQWQQQYAPKSSLDSNPLRLRHKQTDEQCLLLNLSILPEEQSQYIERINKRVGEHASAYLTPLSKWRMAGKQNVCGSRQQLELLYSKVSPTLETILKDRRSSNQGFTSEQIMYIIKAVSYGLKDIQSMGEEHGRVDLTTITITNQVHLKDSLLLDSEQKLIAKSRNSSQIQGYPSPQKLRGFYDSLTSFDEVRGDLFSLGMVALQLVYINEDISTIYVNPNPSYRNYTIDFERLNKMIGGISDPRVRQAIGILTSMESKKRIAVFQMLKSIPIDERRVGLLNPEERNGKNEEPMKVENTIYHGKIKSDFVIESKEPVDRREVRVDNRGYVPQPLELNRDLDNYRKDHFHYYSAHTYNTSSNGQPRPIVSQPPIHFQQQKKSGVTHSTPGVTFSSPPAQSSIPVALSSALPGLTSPPITSNYNPTIHIKNPEVSTSQMHKSNLITIPRDNHYVSSSMGPSSNTVYSTERSHPREERVTVSQYLPAYQPAPVDSQPGKIPTFQDILNRIKNNTPQNTGTVNSPISNLQQQPQRYFESSKPPSESLNNQRQLKFQSNTVVTQLPANNGFVSRSMNVKGAESIYEDEIKEGKPSQNEIKKENNEKKVQKQEEKTEQQQIEKQQPDFKKKESANIEQSSQPKEEKDVPEPNQNQAIEQQQQEKTSLRSGNNPMGATSTVTAVAEVNQEEHQPYYKEGQVIKQANFNHRDSSEQFRSHSNIRSDPKIVVMEPLQMQASSPLRKGPVYVEETYDIGTRYEGYMLHGMRNGKGKFYYKQGSYYDGEWLKNKMHGYGVLYYPNGMVAYEGQWKEDEFDGKGIVYNDQQRQIGGTFDFTDFNQLDDEWVRYQGDLKSDAKDGNGKLILTNGEVYEGQFSQDMVHGVGVFRSGSSEKKGVWENGKLKKLLEVA